MSLHHKIITNSYGFVRLVSGNYKPTVRQYQTRGFGEQLIEGFAGGRARSKSGVFEEFLGILFSEEDQSDLDIGGNVFQFCLKRLGNDLGRHVFWIVKGSGRDRREGYGL